jgi:hypothetical protein
MNNLAEKHTNVQYRRKDLPKGHGIACPSKTDPVKAMDDVVQKILEERKEVLMALSKV